jgi:carbon-monoxide dehydrogenase large subunit
MSLSEISLAAYVPHNYPHEELEPGLDEKAFYDPLNFTYPGGCHICEVEINPKTGEVTVEGMTAVDDVGKVINPMIVEGQIHGGLAQGIGKHYSRTLRMIIMASFYLVPIWTIQCLVQIIL